MDRQARSTRKKTVCDGCGRVQTGWYDRRKRLVRDLSSAGYRIVLELEVRRVACRTCGSVKRERLDFLADNPHFTKRFAFYVGRRCRQASIRDVATELKLDWDTVKTLEMQYMRAQIERAGTPGPKAIGIDEISIRKGHNYRIVVSDLVRKRPLWFGGDDRSEASMTQFYTWLGPKKTSNIRLIVMDMWKPFRNVARDKAPQAAILFDKFHIMRHLGEALDKVRKAEYARLRGNDRRFIKGQKYTLLSHRDNLTLDGKRSLTLLLAANKRLNTAYVLKEAFGQLWDYRREAWARRFFDNWCASLKWQRLGPFERFADMIERHWDGIAAYCKPENKVSLGFVEGVNNKIRVFQRRAYGLKDEEYLRLKVLSCMLPVL
jgi:transposase